MWFRKPCLIHFFVCYAACCSYLGLKSIWFITQVNMFSNEKEESRKSRAKYPSAFSDSLLFLFILRFQFLIQFIRVNFIYYFNFANGHGLGLWFFTLKVFWECGLNSRLMLKINGFGTTLTFKNLSVL